MNAVNLNSFCRLPAIVFYDERLSPRDIAIYAAIIETIKNDKGVCFAAAETLRAKASIGRSAFFDGIQHLQSLGYIDRFDRFGRTNEIHFAPFPVWDFDVSRIPFAFSQSVDKIAEQLVNKSKACYLVFDKRLGRVRFSDGGQSESGYDLDILEEIIKRFKTLFPALPTGLDYPQAKRQALHSIFVSRCDSEQIERFFNGLQVAEDEITLKNRTLKWCITHYRQFL